MWVPRLEVTIATEPAALFVQNSDISLPKNFVLVCSGYIKVSSKRLSNSTLASAEFALAKASKVTFLSAADLI